MEVLARRVGRNELVAIDVCRAYVEAQMEYASRDRDGAGTFHYAQRIASSSGKREGEPDNLVPKAFADAAAAMFAEGKKPEPYHGYYFRILKAQGPDAQGGAADYVVKGQMIGGFALVAFPVEYDVFRGEDIPGEPRGRSLRERPRFTDMHARSCYDPLQPRQGLESGGRRVGGSFFRIHGLDRSPAIP